MNWILLEEFTPDDEEFSTNAIGGKVVGKDTYTPSVGFLKNSYSKLNKMFFDGRLPEDIEFKVEYGKESGGSGHTDADNNRDPMKFDIHRVSLNGTLMKSPHSWIETILHEMIHVDDFAHHPEHFSEDYNEHGEWFVEQAKRFERFGFHIGVKDMDDNVQASVDSEMVRRKFNRSMFILLGTDPVSKVDSMVKIEKSDKEEALAKLKKRGCKTVKVVKTDNLNSAFLDDIDASEVGRKVYQLDKDDLKRYGPFEEVETIDLTNIAESTDKSKNLMKSTMTITRLPNGRIHIRT